MGDVDGHWILNGPGHRAAERERALAAQAEWYANDPHLDHVTVDAGDDWVCDRCNGTIIVVHPNATNPDPTLLFPDGQLRPIPVVDGDAVCDRCLARALGGDLEPANRWPGCGCEPCVDAHAANRAGARP